MLQDGKTGKMAAALDFDALVAQFAALRDDVSQLTGSVTTMAERRGRKMASDLSDGLNEATAYDERKSTGVEAELEKSIAMHPILALGLAAGIGLIVGAMTRRG